MFDSISYPLKNTVMTCAASLEFTITLILVFH